MARLIKKEIANQLETETSLDTLIVANELSNLDDDKKKGKEPSM